MEDILKPSYFNPEQVQRKAKLAEIHENTPEMNSQPFLCL